MELILGGDQTQTMTSKEIAELTGKLHSNVMVDIRNLVGEFRNEAELVFQLSDYKDSTGRTLPMYILTKKETLLLVSGYSAVLRLKIINRWEQLEIQSKKQLPSSYIDALKALVVSEEAKEQALLQVDNLNTVLDNLLDWVSIIKIANHNGIKETYFNWRILKDKSRELGYSIKKAESPRYGYQNLYNLVVFKACYPSLNYNLK